MFSSCSILDIILEVRVTNNELETAKASGYEEILQVYFYRCLDRYTDLSFFCFFLFLSDVIISTIFTVLVLQKLLLDKVYQCGDFVLAKKK